jgi:hypothetical protein
MTVTLELPLSLEERIRHEAQRQGVPKETVILKVLETSIPPDSQMTRFHTLVENWLQEPLEDSDDVLEQLDNNRQAERKLYPQELKGKSWS